MFEVFLCWEASMSVFPAVNFTLRLIVVDSKTCVFAKGKHVFCSVTIQNCCVLFYRKATLDAFTRHTVLGCSENIVLCRSKRSVAFPSNNMLTQYRCFAGYVCAKLL